MKKPTSQEDSPTYSLLKLSEHFEIDRTTLRQRLDNAGIKPVIDKANRKEYRLEDVEPLFESEEDLDALKIRKLKAEAGLKELELDEQRGDLLPRKDVEDHLQKLFTAMFQRLTVRMPKEISRQLHKATSPAQVTTILQTSIQQVFNELRRDHTSLFPHDSEVNS